MRGTTHTAHLRSSLDPMSTQVKPPMSNTIPGKPTSGIFCWSSRRQAKPSDNSGPLFLSKKNEIPDCQDSEALVAFRLDIREEQVTMDIDRQRLRMFAALCELMANYCAMEDAWPAQRQAPSSGLPKVPNDDKRTRRSC